MRESRDQEEAIYEEAFKRKDVRQKPSYRLFAWMAAA